MSISTFTLLIIVFSSLNIIVSQKCGNINCVQGTCVNADYSVCNCDSNYATVPEDNKDNCGYKKKHQLIAFLLEVFVMFGAGHFYILNYNIAIVKMLVWVIGYFIFVAIRFLGNKENSNTSSGVMIAFFGCCFCCIMVFWELVDMILFAVNKYKDGYNIELIPWS